MLQFLRILSVLSHLLQVAEQAKLILTKTNGLVFKPEETARWFIAKKLLLQHQTIQYLQHIDLLPQKAFLSSLRGYIENNF